MGEGGREEAEVVKDIGLNCPSGRALKIMDIFILAKLGNSYLA